MVLFDTNLTLMTPKETQDYFWQYHLWYNTLSAWQKLTFPFKVFPKYRSSEEYFMINVYQPRQFYR
jgi:hypothetical protein